MVFINNMIAITQPWGYGGETDGGERMRAYYENDIGYALETGVDGFALNLFYHASQEALMTGCTDRFYDAADAYQGRFKLFFSIDSASHPQADERLTAAEIRNYMKDFIKRYYRRPSQFRVDGKAVVSTYAGEERGYDFWKALVTELRDEGYPIVFVPVYIMPGINDTPPSMQVFDRYYRSCGGGDGVLDGLGYFHYPSALPLRGDELPPSKPGHVPEGRAWSVLEAMEGYADAVHTNGGIALASISPCHWDAFGRSVRQYYDYEGGKGFANQWLTARQKADWVQVVTWNDYTESHYIAPWPDIPHSWGWPAHINTVENKPHNGYFELMKYYITLFQTGEMPEIQNDALFYFYRTTPIAARPRQDPFPERPIRDDKIFGNEPMDSLCVTVMVKNRGTVLRVISGGQEQNFDVPVGVHHIRTPFFTGEQRFELRRSGTLLCAARGEDIVQDTKTYNLNQTSGFAYSTQVTGVNFAAPSAGASAHMENGSSAAHPAGHAIDGAADTYAQAGGTPPDPQVTLPWGLVVDLGQPRLFNTVQFTLDSEHYTRHFVINTSADRINWVRAVSDTIWPYAMDGGGTFAYSFAPREARFVQLSAKLLHGTENHIIRDFKVYLAQSLT